MSNVDRVVIIGGGPGGYESALVAAQLGAQVTVVDSDGLGGSAVITDCVPSKTLIATAELMTDMSTAQELGVNFHDHQGDAATSISVDLARVNAREVAITDETMAKAHAADAVIFGAVGGPKYIKALKGPLPQIEMVPTGGVNLETAGEFLKAGACARAAGCGRSSGGCRRASIRQAQPGAARCGACAPPRDSR